MSTVTDILYSAWNKDSASVKAAVDDIMSARAADVVADVTVDVASSMYSSTNGEQFETVEDFDNQQDVDSNEEAPNEDF